MTFLGLRLRRRRAWTLAAPDLPAFDVNPLATDLEPPARVPALITEAAAPLLELALRARHAEATIALGAAAGDLAILELRDVRELSAATGPMLRRALEAHGRDIGFATAVWHHRTAELTGAILDDHAGTFVADIAVEAGLHASLALEAAKRDPMAVPGQLAAAKGRVDAVRGLAAAWLRDHGA
jgi:hypothetical protein